jgi:cell wall-associated NlpC family hydrolase
MINTTKLKPGDLLLFRVTPKSSWLAKIIVIGEKILGSSIFKKSYSHIGILDYDTDFMYESRWPRSRRTKLDWTRLNKYYILESYRVKNATSDMIDNVITWCNNHLGMKYDLGLFFFGLFDQKNMEVCSTFVAKAWSSVGVILRRRSSQKLITPDEIIRNKHILKKVA